MSPLLYAHGLVDLPVLTLMLFAAINDPTTTCTLHGRREATNAAILQVGWPVVAKDFTSRGDITQRHHAVVDKPCICGRAVVDEVAVVIVDAREANDGVLAGG